MKRLPAVALGVVCAAAVPAVAVTVAAQGRAPDRAQARAISVIEHADTDRTTDIGGEGDSVGDVLTFANEVYDAADAKEIGTDQGYCVRVVAGAAYECTWTTMLPGGQIVVAGPFFDARDSTLAITGGTGRYRDARGVMRLHALEGGKKFRFAFRVGR
jgi:allene oxide cyclase